MTRLANRISNARSSISGQRQIRRTHFRRLVSIAFAMLLAPNLYESIVLGRPSEISSIAYALQVVFAALLVCYGLYIGVAHRHEIGSRRPAVAFLVMLTVSTHQIVEVANNQLTLASVANLGGTVIVVWALWVLRPEIAWFSVFATWGGMVAGIALLMALFSPGTAFMTNEFGDLIGAYKTDGSRGLLAGPFDNANFLGLVLAASLPFVAVINTARVRAALIALILLTIWLSVSRVALFSAVLVIVASAYFTRRGVGARRLNTVFYACAGLLLVVTILMPFLNEDPRFMTNRGRIWSVGLEAWFQSPWFGNGPAWYHSDLAYSAGSVHLEHGSSHNMAVSWLVTGGVFLAFLAIVLIGVFTRSAGSHLRTGNVAPATFILGLLVVGLLESNWYMSVMSQLFVVRGFLLSALLFAAKEPPVQSRH